MRSVVEPITEEESEEEYASFEPGHARAPQPTQASEGGVFFRPLEEGEQSSEPAQSEPVVSCGYGHQSSPCDLSICVFDPPSANPTFGPNAMYWEVCNRKGHRVGYIKWVAKSSVKRWTKKSKGHHLSACTAIGLGGDAMGVYYGGAGIVGSLAGPEVSGPLFLMSAASDLVGLGFDFAHDFTGC